LITTGPYALVRHLIYTGILTGFLGTAIALSQVRGVIGFGLLIHLVLGQAPQGGGVGVAYPSHTESGSTGLVGNSDNLPDLQRGLNAV
jgi:hypothetical protein